MASRVGKVYQDCTPDSECLKFTIDASKILQILGLQPRISMFFLTTRLFFSYSM